MFGICLSHIPLEIQRTLSAVCLQANQEARVASNFNYLFVHCKCGNISKTVPDRVVGWSSSPACTWYCSWHYLLQKTPLFLQTTNRKWYMAYQFRWPWVTFKVIHSLLHASLASVTFHAALQQLTSFQLTWRVPRSPLR